MASPRPADSMRRFHLYCAMGYTLACLIWTAWAGRDQSWDFLNYHLYVALAWWQGRLPGELFAASVQSYLNPLPHLPYFLIHATGWPALTGALAVAALHSTNLWLLHGIGAQFVPLRDRLHRLILVAGVLAGGLTPAFLLETGTSYTDVVVSIPCLASLFVLLRWRQAATSGRATSRQLWLSAVLAGVAMGLKPSALVFACAMLVAALAGLPGRVAAGALWRALIGGAAGLLLTGGPHAWWLWQSFGSPVFPLFNGIFQSPWYLSANAVADRFRPATLADVLYYPVRLANPMERVGFEAIAADVRPLTLIVFGIAALVLRIILGRQQAQADRSVRVVMLLLTLFLPIWLYTSGNTRYAVPGLMLTGPVIAWLALRLARGRAVWAMLLVGLPLAVQTVAATTLNRTRMDARPWSPSPMDLSIPRVLQETPAYYLSLQLQSYAALAAFLPAESRFSNVIGQNTLAPDGIAWQAIRARWQSSQLPLRSLASVDMLGADGGVDAATLDVQDAQLSEYALRLDRTDCQLIDLDGHGKPPLHWQAQQTPRSAVSQDKRVALVSCAIVETPPLDSVERARRREVDRRMTAWEQHCPALFAPAGTNSEQAAAGTRRRFYVNTDTWLIETNGRLAAVLIHAGRSVPLENATGERLQTSCPRPYSTEADARTP